MRDLKDVVVEYRKALDTEQRAWDAQHHASKAFTAACENSKALRVELLKQHLIGGRKCLIVTLPDRTVLVAEGYQEAAVTFFNLEGNEIR